MKVKIILISLFSLLFLVGCEEQSSKLFETKSSNGKISITVQGNRSSSFDPWKADIKMTIEGKDPVSSFVEVYADELNDKNVDFTWKSENECLITFTQRDGVVVPVPIKVQGL